MPRAGFSGEQGEGSGEKAELSTQSAEAAALIHYPASFSYTAIFRY